MKHVVALVFGLALGGELVAQQDIRLTPPHTAWDEFNPVLSPDGKALYFNIARHPQNTGGKRDPGDIWVTRLQQGAWTTPVPVPELNHQGFNAVLGFGAEGRDIYLAGHYAGKDPARTQGIAVATWTGKGWSAPRNITIPYFLNKSTDMSGHVTPDGKAFVFAAEGYSSEGLEDIYVTFQTATGWSEPRNLGRMINTPLQEVTPWLSADQKTLYFASNGRQGYGSFDIYFTQRMDDSWALWTQPVNMGAKVNSEGREMYYHSFPAQRFGLFMTTHNSDGYGEIKKHVAEAAVDSVLTQVREQKTVDTLVRIVPIKRERPIAQDDKLVTISGKVVNSKTNAPLEASIHYKSDSTYSTRSLRDGTYSLQIPSTSVYGVTVEAPGYIGNFEKLDIHTYEMKTLSMNFRLQPVEIGALVNLKSVLFQQSTSILLEESDDELNMVVDFMKSNPKVEIELAGHTDNRGLHQHNMKLSRERVEKVKAYLVEHGIAASRITGKGYGGTRPIADNDAEDTRRLNRRVEFMIVKD